jgi:hypothetical protein
MYLRNPFVIIGIVGIMYHLWQRRNLAQEQTKYDKLLSDYLKSKKETDEDGLLVRFKRDIEAMSNEQIIKSIKENEKELANTTDPKEKKELAKMLHFCAETYNNRPKKK